MADGMEKKVEENDEDDDIGAKAKQIAISMFGSGNDENDDDTVILTGNNEADLDSVNKVPANQRVTFRENPKLKIDYVLTYKKMDDDDVSEGAMCRRAMRESYEENLKDFGIKIEREQADKDCFVMLHCPFMTLCKGAQILKLKKPIKKQNQEANTVVERKSALTFLWSKLGGKELLVHQEFKIKNLDNFHMESKETFFTSAERNFIIHSIMERTMFKNKNKVQTGLGCLLGYDAYLSAYPLHDPITSKQPADGVKLNEREKLNEHWVKMKNIFYLQPYNEIRSYFGEQFTFYFAWMGLYTASLFAAALAGLACFIYGLASFSTIDDNVKEICDETKAPGNYTMCPKCDFRCNYTKLSGSCNNAKFSRVFDNEATLACAIFICVWAICFMELWKRRQLALQHEWNVTNFEADENVRPEFVSQTNTVVKNPWSGEEEPVVSTAWMIGRTLTSISVLLFLLSMVVIAIFAVLVYRLALVYALYQSDNLTIKAHAKIITTITAAILNVIAISVLGFIYQKLAKILTNLEAHKTRTSYEDSFIFKIVVFQCINNYGSIIYIAFFKGSFVDRPGFDKLYMFSKYRQDECEDTGCFSELTIQLIVVMIGKQFLNALIEMLAPIFKKCLRSRDNKDLSSYMQWERDLDLECHPPISMFGEYLEMVIQYGFVTLFVVAFPLAPLFAFLNNIIEIRLDAYKMVKLFRRCAALKAQDIGAWEVSLQMISYMAVISNAFIIAWTSDFIPKAVYKWNADTRSLSGYMNWTLAPFNVSEFKANQRPDVSIYPEAANVTQCMYRTFSAPADEIGSSYISFYWQIQCARWSFVIVFEHCALLLMSLARMIPDTSKEVKLKLEYEKAMENYSEVDDLFIHVKERKKFLNVMMLQGAAGNNVGFSDSVQE